MDCYTAILFSCRREVLDVLAQLNDDYNSSTDWERIKLCRALLLVLLYTAIPPGRGREYRELHFKIHEREITGPYESRSSKNIMHFSSYEGKAIMYITDHKTGHSTGPQMISCPDDSYFMNVLSDYLLRYRNKIPNSSKSTILFLVSSMHASKNTHVHVHVCLSIICLIRRE